MKYRNSCIAALSVGAVALALWTGCGRSSLSDPEPDKALAAEIRGGEATAVADASGPAAGPTGEGWGDLVGVLVFDGQPPRLGNLSTGGKDAEVCDKHPIPDESLIVDSGTGGIKNVVIYARRTSREHESYAETAEESVVFDQEGCVFLSHVLPLRTSQTLQIKNSDPIGHNTNISPPADRPVNVLLAGGDVTDFQFTRQQNAPVPVACNIHPWMKAYVLPRNDPYFAVTDEQGRFEIKHLPAGEEIEFQIWHERAADSQGGLNIPGTTDNRGRFTLTVPADGQYDLQTLKVPAGSFQ